MARSNRSFGLGPGIVVAVALAIVASGCGDSPRVETNSVRVTAARASEPKLPAPHGTEPVTASVAARSDAMPPDRMQAHAASATPATPPSPAVPGRIARRSPLENSPGYFPPDDPESASVRLGRREAKPVDDEFSGGAASLEDLAGRIVEALNTLDEPSLHRLRVTRQEFERILWPEFPESRPVTNITAADAWSLSEPRSLTGASRAMGLQGGKHLRLVRVEHAPPQEFTNFQLYRGVTIVATDEASGEIVRVRVAPSVAARHGRYKALLFRD